MRTLHLLAVAQLFALAHSMPVPVMAQTVVPLVPFRSVELRNGAEVILRHGPAQRVTLLKGSLDYTRVTIADGGRLVIDKCKSRCPREYVVEIEIVTPDIAGISVTDGGTIQSRGSFPRQAEIGAAVREGGTIDIRSMAVDKVTASVEQGGRILATPQTALFASVVEGGEITYWGDGRVESSVRRGGAVTKGTAAEADKPLSELSPPASFSPAVPPVPPIQPIRNVFWHHHPSNAQPAEALMPIEQGKGAPRSMAMTLMLSCFVPLQERPAVIVSASSYRGVYPCRTRKRSTAANSLPEAREQSSALQR